MVHFFMKIVSSCAAVLTDVRVRQHSFCDGNIFIFSITFRQKFFHSFMIITVYRDSIKKWKSNIIFKNPCRQRIHATYKGSYFSNFEGIWGIRFPQKFLSFLLAISLHHRTLKRLHHGWRQFSTILIEVNRTFFRLFYLFQLFLRSFLPTLNN